MIKKIQQITTQHYKLGIASKALYGSNIVFHALTFARSRGS